jgi:hypothetical protein
MEQIVVNVREKVSVLEIEQHQQIDKNTRRQKQTLLTVRLGVVNTLSQNEIGQSGKNQNENKQSARLEIKKQTDGKQKRVSQQPPIINQAESRDDKRKKRPKIKLREQQRTLCVKGKYFLQVDNDVIPLHL